MFDHPEVRLSSTRGNAPYIRYTDADWKYRYRSKRLKATNDADGDRRHAENASEELHRFFMENNQATPPRPTRETTEFDSKAAATDDTDSDAE